MLLGDKLVFHNGNSSKIIENSCKVYSNVVFIIHLDNNPAIGFRGVIENIESSFGVKLACIPDVNISILLNDEFKVDIINDEVVFDIFIFTIEQIVNVIICPEERELEKGLNIVTFKFKIEQFKFFARLYIDMHVEFDKDFSLKSAGNVIRINDVVVTGFDNVNANV